MPAEQTEEDIMAGLVMVPGYRDEQVILGMLLADDLL